jgi:hypothetical protein
MSLPKILVPCAVGKTGIVVAFGVIPEFMALLAARSPERRHSPSRTAVARPKGF